MFKLVSAFTWYILLLYHLKQFSRESHFRLFKFQHVFNLDNDNGAEDTPTLIDRKVSLVHWKLSGVGGIISIILAK
jgi:hypothetical protein